MLNRFLCLIFFVLFFNRNHAQTNSTWGNCCEKSKAGLYVDSLSSKFEEQGYTEWVAYKHSTEYVLNFNDCSGFIYHVSYLLKKENKLILKKLVFCSDSLVYNKDTLLTNDLGIFDFIAKEKDIAVEEILHYVYRSKNDTLQAYFPIISVLHATYYTIEYTHAKKGGWVKGIMRESVMEEIFKDYKNLNYKYNINTAIYKLWKLMQKITQSETSEKLTSG